MARNFLVAVLALSGALTWAAAPTPISVAETVDTPAPDSCPEAIELVIGFEISSRAYYNRHLIRPTWPGAASGVTIGIGYDLGHQVRPVIAQDWREHRHVDELGQASGVKGAAAKALVPPMRHIETPLNLASEVFEESTVPRYWQSAERAFPGMQELRPCAQGALFSLVYNRGSAMAGSTRQEMRAIRDECVPMRDHLCIAEQIRKMVRLWEGTSIENGMRRRRQAEAEMVLQ